MTWVRIDDQFADHPKVVGLSSDAFRLHVSAMCYCSAQLTDGRVTALLTRRLTWFVTDTESVTNELVTAGLWEKDGDDYMIHDYLEYNPSADEVRQQRKANADRQAKHRNSKRNTNRNGVSNALRNASVTAPPSPSPDDDERSAALTDLQVLGLFNKTMLEQFDDLWPELAGRRDWIGKAITVSRDNNASSPAYALKVLANSVHTGKEPGYTNGASKVVPFKQSQARSFTDEQLAYADKRQEVYEYCLEHNIIMPNEIEAEYIKAGVPTQ